VRRTVVAASVAIALLTASCGGGGRDAASQKACNDTRAVLKLYDQYRSFVPELRAVAAEAMGPKLAGIAKTAKGAVRTSIQALADGSNGLNLDSGQLVTELQPQLASYDSRIAAARPAFESACK
jgi:hypothetical protein